MQRQTADEADRIIEQAARAQRLEDSLSAARETMAVLDHEPQDARALLGDSASVVDSLQRELDYQIGVSRTEQFGPMGCRFWILPVDLTGDRKEIFRERESQLLQRFWFRW